jgi:ribosome-binding protein aMBF1 (putative translation factor)
VGVRAGTVGLLSRGRPLCHRQRVVTGSLGERIAAYRRRRGLSQATVAGLVGRSESWLSQVERRAPLR